MKRPIPRGRKSGASVPASVKVAADRAWADCALSDLVDWAGAGAGAAVAKPNRPPGTRLSLIGAVNKATQPPNLAGWN